ncbi:MAG: ATPase domain-containing protein [Thermoanaerobaculia bacterium]
MKTELISTGTPGLDEILGGGLPRNRAYLIQGEPGVGKTTLGLQFLLAGRDSGESGLYVCLSETEEELEEIAQSHGWTTEGVTIFQLSPGSDALTGDEENTLFHPSEVELAEISSTLLDQVQKVQPKRVVFDSLSEIRLLAQSGARYRRQILALKEFFTRRNCTVWFLDDSTDLTGDRHLQTIAHGVMALEQRAPIFGPYRRRMKIVKLRGIEFISGYHDFRIIRSGLRVYPRLVAAEHREAHQLQPLLSGVPRLDALTGGGLDRGNSTLLMGPAGTGKSAVAMQFCVAAAERGERSVLFNFDETTQSVIKRSQGFGIDLKKYLAAGLLEIRQIDPGEMPPGEFLSLVREAVEEKNTRVVVIDSLNGYLNAMPDESFLTIQMHELLTYLGQKGVASILIVSQAGLIGSAVDAPIDLSYLADCVILLRYFEFSGEVRKAISVLKKRTGLHETAIRELRLSSEGIHLGEPLREFTGVLQGIPRLNGQSDLESDELDARAAG